MMLLTYQKMEKKRALIQLNNLLADSKDMYFLVTGTHSRGFCMRHHIENHSMHILQRRRGLELVQSPKVMVPEAEEVHLQEVMVRGLERELVQLPKVMVPEAEEVHLQEVMVRVRVRELEQSRQQ
jgi:hypothetical protein